MRNPLPPSVDDATVRRLERLVRDLRAKEKLSEDERDRLRSQQIDRVLRATEDGGVSHPDPVKFPGTAIATMDETEFRKRLRAIDDDLGAQVTIVAEGIEHYFQTGEMPAPYYAWRIAVILRKGRLYEREADFLEAFAEKFGDGVGRRYRDIVDRAPKARELARRIRGLQDG